MLSLNITARRSPCLFPKISELLARFCRLEERSSCEIWHLLFWFDGSVASNILSFIQKIISFFSIEIHCRGDIRRKFRSFLLQALSWLLSCFQHWGWYIFGLRLALAIYMEHFTIVPFSRAAPVVFWLKFWYFWPLYSIIFRGRVFCENILTTRIMGILQLLFAVLREDWLKLKTLRQYFVNPCEDWGFESIVGWLSILSLVLRSRRERGPATRILNSHILGAFIPENIWVLKASSGQRDAAVRSLLFRWGAFDVTRWDGSVLGGRSFKYWRSECCADSSSGASGGH